jgi:hypothetical protein
VLFRFRDFLGHRQVLLVRHRENDAFDFRIGEHRLQVRDGRHAHLLLKCRAFIFAAAVARDDFQLVGFRRGTGEDLGPAAEAHDADFDGVRHE